MPIIAQRGFGLLAYGLIALAVIGSLAGLYGTVHHSGVNEGRAEITAQWEKQAKKNREIVLADRKRQEGVRQQQDEKQSRRLADEKKRTGVLMASVEAHIKAKGAFANCRLSDGLLGDANNALAGGQGERPGAVPSASKPTAPTR